MWYSAAAAWFKRRWPGVRDWVLQPLFWLALGYAASLGRSWLTNRPFKQIWQGIAQDQRTVPIVMGDVTFKEFPLPDYLQSKTARLPGNVSLVGVDDAMGVSLLREALVNRFGVIDAPLIFAGEADPFVTTSSFVSVGGASVNRMTHRVLDLRKLDSKLKMIYPDHYAVDEKDNQPYRAEEQEGRVTSDYGFIIVGPSPFNPHKTVCVVFGIWPQGTRAAIQALVDPESSPKGKELVDRIKDNRRVVAIVRTEVTNLNQGPPQLVKVRDLEPPDK